MLHILLHPALIRVMKLQRKQELLILNEHPKVEKNVIYAVNHSCVHDTPIASEVIKRHTYVLAAKQRLRFIDYVCLMLNGVIWVNRDDRQSKHRATKWMERMLNKGKNVCIFPEGTWNLTATFPYLIIAVVAAYGKRNMKSMERGEIPGDIFDTYIDADDYESEDEDEDGDNDGDD